MSEIEKMERYIEKTPKCCRGYSIDCKSVVALSKEYDRGYAIMMAFMYGRAKGYRAAKAEGKKEAVV